MTVVYLDLLFLLNLSANYLLLLLTGRMTGQPLRRGLLAAAAAARKGLGKSRRPVL